MSTNAWLMSSALFEQDTLGSSQSGIPYGRWRNGQVREVAFFNSFQPSLRRIFPCVP